jgi:putative addiction module component (TIGR02574 family)
VKKDLMREIKKLSRDERIALAQDIWDTVAEDNEPTPLSRSQMTELKRRMAAHKKNPDESIPWEVVKAELDSRFK